MTNEVSYSFKGFKNLKLDLLNKTQQISEIEQCWVALAYLNRQSAMFVECNYVVNLFPSDIFDKYVRKAENKIKIPEGLSSVINELDSIIPDGEESSGWEFDFVQNSLLSLLSFFNFLVDRKSSLFIDVILGVLINIDVIWSEESDEVDESVELSKEVTLLYKSIEMIKKSEDKEFIVDNLAKIHGGYN